MLPAALALLALAHAEPLPPGTYVLGVTGMDDPCCASKVAAAVDGVDGISGAAADHARAVACARLDRPVERDAIDAAVKGAGYGLGSVSPGPCPEGLAFAPTDPWSGASGVDATIVSHGEAFALKDVAVPGKFTIVDFGAQWCAPCFESAKALKAYLATHADTAVRAAWLDAGDPRKSFALPVAQQHLQFAEGLPHFVVLSRAGKQIYAGSAHEKALAAIDKARK